MAEFKPSIATRTTKELLEIVGAIENWNNEAVEQARVELNLRKVSEKEIQHAEYLAERANSYEDLKRARESYSMLNLISEPIQTLLEILFSWELKKDGFLRKAEQQKKMRFIFACLILIIITYIKITAH